MEKQLHSLFVLVLMLGLIMGGPSALAHSQGNRPLIVNAAPLSPAGSVLYAAPGGLTSGACNSWANACTLQRALSVAASGDEIWVKTGVHKPGAARTDTFTLKNGVAIYGGFAGSEGDRNLRNWQTNVTVLSGDIDNNDINTDGNSIAETAADIQGNNCYHVVSSASLTASAVLDGFFITAGQANDPDWNWPDYVGAGMYNDNSSPTLANITFSGNTATAGDGMYNYYSSPTLTYVTFSGNTEDGMYNHYSHPTLTHATFSGNAGHGMFNERSSPTLTHVTFSGNLGGGMYNYELSHPTLADVTFSGNTSDYGAGMYNDLGSNPTLTNVTFSGNTATGGANTWGGGGMFNKESSPTLVNVTFINNSTRNNGGGINNLRSSPKLTNVTFISNTADNDGGGMYNYYLSHPPMTNTTFIRNIAYHSGGGMYQYQSSPQLANAVFIGNRASDAGGGMYNNYQSNPTLTNVSFYGNSADNRAGGIRNYNNAGTVLTNAILWGNIAPEGPQVFKDATSTLTVAYSDIQGCGGSGSWNSACGTNNGGNIDANPLFVDASHDNLRLQSTSPAIDAGNNAAVPAGVTTDLDGNPRFVDIPAVPNTGSGAPPIVDMGAYEAQASVSISKAVSPATVAPGDAITFTLTLVNSSGVTATHIVVTDTLPAFLTGTSFTATLAVTDTGALPRYVWSAQNLLPGQSGVITITGVLTASAAGGTYTNTATFTATGDSVASDNTANATFTVTAANAPPFFVSAPITQATQSLTYNYAIATQDPNSDTLTITAPTRPSWLALTDHGNGTATLAGTPTSAHVGDHPVVLRVTDSGGLFAEQSFTITVRAGFCIYLPLVVRSR